MSVATIVSAISGTNKTPANIATSPIPVTANNPNAKTAIPNPVIDAPTLRIQPNPGYLLYLPLANTLSVITIDTAINGTNKTPANIATSPIPVTANNPNVKTATPNPVINTPTVRTHPNPGYLLYLPLDITLSVITIDKAISGTNKTPASIANAPTPVSAIDPRTRAAAANPVIDSPTPIDHLQSGNLSYLPIAKICEETAIAAAINGIINTPKAIAPAPTPDIAAIPTNKTDGIIANTIIASATPNNAILRILPNSISAVIANI